MSGRRSRACTVIAVVLAVACAWPRTSRGEEAASRHGSADAGGVRFRGLSVNGIPIAVRHLDAAFKLRLAGLQAFHAPLSDRQRADLARDVEENEVIKQLFLLDAEKRGIRLDAEGFRRRLEEEYQRYGGKEKYVKFLERAGLDEVAFRGLMERTLLAERYIREVVAAGLVVSETEAAERYDEDRWRFETPERVRFGVIALTILSAPLTEAEIALVESFPRRIDTEDDFREEGERLSRTLSGRVRAERQADVEWDQERGGELWENLGRIPVGKAGVYGDRGKRYFLYFVKARIPGSQRVERAEALSQIRKQLLEEKTREGIKAKVQELRSSAEIRME